MHRFYCPELLTDQASTLQTVFTESANDDTDDPSALQQPILPDTVVQLNATESHHAARVLRLKEGEPVELINGRGLLAAGVIQQIKPAVAVRITQSSLTPAEPCSLHIAICIPKGSHADEMINQLSQLGVDRLTPLLTTRGTVQPRENKIERLGRIAVTAAKQCGRLHLMQLDQPIALADLIHRDLDLKLLADPLGSPDAIDRQKLAKHRHVTVIVGPEGGLTDEERKLAIDAGFELWNINRNILRIETAGAAVAAIIAQMSLHQSPG